MQGIILYGPPASGKDTVTHALHDINSDCVLFPRLKSGPGRRTGYRMTTDAAIDEMRAMGGVIWENRRYGAVYVVDRSELLDRLSRHIPVLHLGQVEAVHAVISAVPNAQWLVVSLWCPRTVAANRIVKRGTADTEARLRAWDETTPLASTDIKINTEEATAENAAHRITEALYRLQRV